MSSHLKSIFTVSIGTFGSRVFGLLRDVAMAAFLGVSAASNAFIFAFTVPNLFRRLLGEGALTSAFIPVLSRIVGNDKKEAAAATDSSFTFINRVLTRLLTATVLLSLLLGIVYTLVYLWLNHQPPQPEHEVAGWLRFSPQMLEQWTRGMALGLILLPYLPMICLAAILSAALNVRGHFAVPAVAPLLLNLCMIAALLLGGFLFEGPDRLVVLLCVGVLLGGLLQLLSPALVLYRHGWRPRLDFSAAEHMQLLWRLFIPGVLGAAALQINVFVSRILAFGLNETATTTLNYVNRLVELPLGLFAVAIATVIFPQMSLLLAREDTEAYRRSFGQGLRLMLAVTLPATVGLIVLAEPILTLLFRWGRFSAADVGLMVPLLCVAALSIPFYAVSAFLTRAYHAGQDTRTPARIAVVVLLTNLVLSLVLMPRFEAVGLAAANTISSLVQVALMAIGLRRPRADVAGSARGGLAPLVQALLQCVMACVLMGGIIAFGNMLLQGAVADAKLVAALACVLLIPLGALIYGGVLWMMGFEDRHAIAALLLRRRPDKTVE